MIRLDPKRQKIVISVDLEEEAGKAKPQPEALLLGNLPGQYPYRRPRRRKVTPPPKGAIHIYDMGRKWNGSAFVDVDFHFQPRTYGHTSASDVWVGWASISAALSHYTDMRNYIIDYDLANIATMHPHLGSEDDGYWFGFLLYDGLDVLRDSSDDPDWTPQGWKLTQEDLDSSDLYLSTADYNLNLFHTIVFRGTTYVPHKVTAVYDRSAPAVPFNLTLGDSIFLMPIATKPVFSQHYIDNVEYPPGSFANRDVVDYFTGDAMIIPRSKYLDPTNENYRDGVFDGYGDEAPVPSVYFEKRIRLIHQVGFNLKRERAFYVPAFRWQWQVMNPALYPHAYDTTANDGVFTFEAFWVGDANVESLDGTGTVSFFHGFVPAGALLAIVKRGSDLFFIWK